MKMFVVITELEIICAVKSFLEVYPEYGELVSDLHFSQENLTKLKRWKKRDRYLSDPKWRVYLSSKSSDHWVVALLLAERRGMAPL